MLDEFFKAVNRKVDYLFSILNGANQLCIWGRSALPVVQMKYPNNVKLLAAIQAMNVACEAVALAISLQKQHDVNREQNPDAPLPVQPEPPWVDPEPEPDPDPDPDPDPEQ